MALKYHSTTGNEHIWIRYNGEQRNNYFFALNFSYTQHKFWLTSVKNVIDRTLQRN